MMSKSRYLAQAAAAIAAMVMTMPVRAALEYNMPVGVTDVSRQVHDLHMIIFWICVAIGVVVFGAMLVSMIMHRKSIGHEPATFHESTKVEILWTIVPLFILVAMAIPATRVLVEIYDTGGEDMVVEVRGYQWKWEYKYLDASLNEQVSFFSNLATSRAEITNQTTKNENYLLEVDNELVIPANTKVRFLLTANDVIHSWWVPDFAIKKDAIPGFVNEAWTYVEEPGIYRGQCTELCGKDHGFMPIVVRVVPKEEFQQWYAAQLGTDSGDEALAVAQLAQ
jgi:cytochrome c oxidase subunit 2